MNEQRIFRFIGRVQGVGFRYTACRVAGGIDVTGYVRNVSDGSVECVVEGEKREINAFLAALTVEMGHHIRETKQQTAPPTGQFPTFGVRY